MISDIIDLCISISATITVSSEIAVAFCISICRLTPVNIIERRDTSNWLTSTASSEKCQCVMVYWSHPPTQLNPETSGHVQHLTHQPFVHQCVMVS